MDIQKFIEGIRDEARKYLHPWAVTALEWGAAGVAFFIGRHPLVQGVKLLRWLFGFQVVRRAAISIGVEVLASIAQDLIDEFNTAADNSQTSPMLYNQSMKDWISYPIYLRRYFLQVLREAIENAAWEAFVEYIRANQNSFDENLSPVAQDVIFIDSNEFDAEDV